MELHYFFIKLIPPRPDFQTTMDAEERNLMGEHLASWKKLLAENKVILFGPVLGPLGGYGAGIIQADNEAQAWKIMANDPTIVANLQFSVEISPMLVVH